MIQTIDLRACKEAVVPCIVTRYGVSVAARFARGNLVEAGESNYAAALKTNKLLKTRGAQSAENSPYAVLPHTLHTSLFLRLAVFPDAAVGLSRPFDAMLDSVMTSVEEVALRERELLETE